MPMGVGGKAIPPYIDRLTNLSSDAKFILLVEKDAAFMRLAEDRFYNKYPCIIRTAKGQPDVATRIEGKDGNSFVLPRVHHSQLTCRGTFGFQYLTKEYLPRKLRDGSDWILQSVDTFPFY
ncbi:hypothetical protein DYB32_000279 [Aphanomyces invadans]|uniref:Topoisomerase 6 subunit A/Spo11 TOPRIM domain-containing protein n=1 Tax=Aphanomyces invadans TaxID=157072 RepID=A0A3R6YH02_9STRA|nr:hypothetical protein DYB32_000279 [Aphanomyces invadans]